MVAAGLHHPLAGHDPMTGIGVLARTEMRFEHRGLGFLHLQDYRVGAVATEHQSDPGPGADTADADDLAGHVDQLKLVEQAAPVDAERVPVPVQGGAHPGHDVRGPARIDQLLDRDQYRWVTDEARLAVADLDEFAERLQVVVRARLGYRPAGQAGRGSGRVLRAPGARNVSTGRLAYQTRRLVQPANSVIARR